MAVTINHQTNDISATSGSLTIDGAAASGYTDADVDTHLNTGTASADEVLSWNGSDYDWIAAGGGGAALTGVTQSVNPYQTRLGHAAGNAGSGQYSVFVGYQAGENSTGPHNVVIGGRAFENNTSGSYNTFVGGETGQAHTTGNENVGIGYYALANVTTGSSNVAIGSWTATSLTTGRRNTVIGRAAQPSSATVSNEITLGTSSASALRCQVTTITSLSDARDKTDIQPLNAGLEFVEALNPVSFTWNMRDGGKVGVADTGFIAQDLQAAQADTGVTIPDLVFDVNPDKLEAGYGKLIPVLVQAVKDLSEKVKDLEAKLEAK